MPTLEEALCGELPPLVTPLCADGAVDHRALTSLVDHVAAGGVDGFFACGTTGEFASLTAEERRAVVETVVKASGDRPVLAGAAATAVEDAVAHANAAASVGADAVVLTAPYFHAGDDDGVRQFLDAVADEAPLPVVLYNIPTYVGTSLAPETVATLAARPDVVGIKDSSGDLAAAQTYARRTPPSFRVLVGYDPLLLPGLRVGLDGGINALANVVPELFAAVFEAPDSERAGRASDAIAECFEACAELGFARAVKVGLVARDVIDSEAVRPPLTQPTDAERERVASAVATTIDAV